MRLRRYTCLYSSCRSTTSFSNDVILSTIAAVEANPELANTKKFNVAEARATLQFLNAFRPIVDQVDELRTNVRFTYLARKARIMADALQTYAIANGLGRDPSSAAVAGHAVNIKRDLHRPRQKKEKKDDKTAAEREAARKEVMQHIPDARIYAALSNGHYSLRIDGII